MTTETKESFWKRTIVKKWQSINDEKWLRTIANIILFAGIAVSIYFTSFIKMTVEENMYSASGDIIGSYSKSEFNWNILLTILATLLGTFLIWSFLRVITNISSSQKTPKEKLLSNNEYDS